jgi:hypothetical protein
VVSNDWIEIRTYDALLRCAGLSDNLAHRWPQQMASDSKPDLGRSMTRTRTDRVADFFLRAKHWQIFLLVFVVDFVGEVVTIFMLSIKASSMTVMQTAFPYAIVATLSLCAYLAWLWSMGSFLSSIVQPQNRIGVASFRVTLVYPALYAFSFLAFYKKVDSLPETVVIPLHLFAMFCFLHNIYFVSNQLVVAESGEPTGSFLDYAWPFLLLCCYPVGVWFIQPRINRLYAQRIRA